MNKFDNNKIMLWAVKVSVTVFNVFDTWYAFDDVFSQTNRPAAVKVLTTMLAIFTIDIVFLWVLSVLESPLEIIKKIPYALAAVLFALFSVWIGFNSEKNILAFAPRIGLLLVVFIYVTTLGADFWKRYFSREEIEKRLQNRKVIQRRKVDEKTYKQALKESEASFKQKHLVRIREQLGVDAPIQAENETKEIPEHVFIEDGGAIGWQSPFTHEIFLTTSTGKPYTLRGAQIAASRHIAEMSKNGRH